MRRELLLPFWKAQDSQRAKIATSLIHLVPWHHGSLRKNPVCGSSIPSRIAGDIDAQNVL